MKTYFDIESFYIPVAYVFHSTDIPIPYPADWIATNADGSTWGYMQKPEPLHSKWSSFDDKTFIGQYGVRANWRDSLIDLRPFNTAAAHNGSNSAAIAAHLRYLADKIEEGVIRPQIGTVILCDDKSIKGFNLNGTPSEISESMCNTMAPLFAREAQRQADEKGRS